MSKQFARDMRQHMTDAEMRLWFRLRPMRRLGLAFRRQSAVGIYVLDFECRKAKLGVELDGSQHGMTDTIAHDQERTAWFEREGYKILRFWNRDVLKHTDIVVDQILEAAEQRARAFGKR
jgi:very-short-patch-repair endonuclease